MEHGENNVNMYFFDSVIIKNNDSVILAVRRNNCFRECFFVIKPLVIGELCNIAVILEPAAVLCYPDKDNIIFIPRSVLDYGACGNDRNIMLARYAAEKNKCVFHWSHILK